VKQCLAPHRTGLVDLLLAIFACTHEANEQYEENIKDLLETNSFHRDLWKASKGI